MAPAVAPSLETRVGFGSHAPEPRWGERIFPWGKGEMMIPSYFTVTRSALEMISRRQYQTARLSDRVLLCRVLGKYIVYADPEDLGITPHLCLDGFWESWVTIAMARTLKHGWCCIDVGANHGYYTLIMADAVESTGRVLAVEPNPRLAELLSRTVQVNGFQRYAMVLQKAVSDRHARRANLVVPRHHGLDGTLCRKATACDDVVEVETVTLDQLAADWPRVDLIKIDAEGSEEAIWRGMRKTLARHGDVTVIMEMKCSRYVDPSAFVHAIQLAGFPLRHIDYDASVRDVTAEQILSASPETDWMLFLRRP
jgi:FkbM family methyltransferase